MGCSHRMMEVKKNPEKYRSSLRMSVLKSPVHPGNIRLCADTASVTANADVAHTLIMFLRPGFVENDFFSSQSMRLRMPPSGFEAALLSFQPVMLNSSVRALVAPPCRMLAWEAASPLVMALWMRSRSSSILDAKSREGPCPRARLPPRPRCVAAPISRSPSRSVLVGAPRFRMPPRLGPATLDLAMFEVFRDDTPNIGMI